MKALVVGGAGYIGSVVTRLLVDQGHQVVVLDDCSTGHADSVPDGVELQQRDITEVADVLRDGGFDAVLHFAAVEEKTSRWTPCSAIASSNTLVP